MRRSTLSNLVSEKNRNTNDNLYLLCQEIKQNFNRKNKTDVIFIDFEKAFDKVWKKGLLYKLYKLGLSKDLFLVKEFIIERVNKIHLNGKISNAFDTESGVPREAV